MDGRLGPMEEMECIDRLSRILHDIEYIATSAKPYALFREYLAVDILVPQNSGGFPMLQFKPVLDT